MSFSLNLARPHLIQRLMSLEKASLKLFWFSWLCWWSETLKLCSVVKSDIKGIEICCYDNIKASQTGLHLYHLQVGFKSIMTFEMLVVGTDSRKKKSLHFIKPHFAPSTENNTLPFCYILIKSLQDWGKCRVAVVQTWSARTWFIFKTQFYVHLPELAWKTYND